MSIHAVSLLSHLKMPEPAAFIVAEATYARARWLRRSLRNVGASCAFVLAASGCSSPTTATGFGGPTTTATTPNGGGGPGPVDPIVVVPDGGAPTTGGCSEAAKLVYVITDTGALYSFKPDTLVFTSIGTVKCANDGGGYNSMAVDRSGTAWVNAQSGALFKVSTTDASCKPTSYVAETGPFKTFGMAFSSNSVGSNDETLYVASNAGIASGNGLASIDTTTFKLKRIGDYGGAVSGQSAELTGTGDAKLFGFFTTAPARLGEITKATGVTPTTRAMDGVSTGSAFAFSFWGGDFWFYTAQAVGTSSVTRLKQATDKSISVVKANLGFKIVGAGVSTCAPTSPPVN
jgi:hypothetical protein